MMRQHIKLTVVLVAVVLALTGFSSSSHGGKSGKSRKSSSSSSGGGCSNSKKHNGTYHDNDYDDDDDYSGSSSSSTGSTYGTPTPTATDAPRAYVFRCAQPGKGKRKAVTTSTVRLTAAASAVGSHTYEVDVNFLDAVGNTVDTGEATVEADGGETKTVSVRMVHPNKVSRVKKCAVTAELSF
ncbi:hypothetical protein [Streptomyces sp. ITFR-16]|uniref:hypothetical protein n=1 Tax=Streptomyces sp. ITFR-16 TaxID=3075198 RepID=UPI00288956E2|nr:hypothetical protein [Streptomyces sp. ITFR-16]WNI23148.1 hypothetical protein RLT58_14975 [Streptomyces sp. ITFR-16]